MRLQLPQCSISGGIHTTPVGPACLWAYPYYYTPHLVQLNLLFTLNSRASYACSGIYTRTKGLFSRTNEHEVALHVKSVLLR